MHALYFSSTPCEEQLVRSPCIINLSILHSFIIYVCKNYVRKPTKRLSKKMIEFPKYTTFRTRENFWKCFKEYAYSSSYHQHTAFKAGLIYFHELVQTGDWFVSPSVVIFPFNLPMKWALDLSLSFRYEVWASSTSFLAFPHSSIKAYSVLRQSFLFSSRCSNLMKEFLSINNLQ